MKRRIPTKAFTLIEVLVVVAIIALLISILMPSLKNAREAARMSVCKSNMKQVALGMTFYSTEQKVLPATQTVLYWNNILYGNGWWGTNLRSDDPGRLNWVWDGALNTNGGSYTDTPENLKKFRMDCPRRGTIFRYTRNEKVYLCPSDWEGAPDENTPLGGGGNGRSSYSMNAYLGYKAPEKLTRPASRDGWELYDPEANPPTIKVYTRTTWAPSSMFMILEEHPAYNINFTREGNFNVTDRIVTRHMPGFKGPQPKREAKGRSNIAYVDGHVESPLYRWSTTGYTLFRQIGLPGEKREFMKNFIPILPQRN